MNCKEALPIMHEYFDGLLDGEGAAALRRHLAECPACAARFRAYERTEALMRSLRRPETPPGLTASILAALPPETRRRSWFRWIRRHPAAAVTAAFLIVMLGSFLSIWDQDSRVTVSGDDLDGIIVEGDKVIVPEGTRLDGNLTVRNAEVRVDGELAGNLTIIDGSVAYASAAHISGRVTKVDRALDYIWLKIEEWFGALVPAW